MHKKHVASRVINTIWVTACGIVFLMPLLWMLSSSVKLPHEVFSPEFKWIPDVIQWKNYVQVWTHEKVPFWNLYLNSLTIAVVGTVGELIIASMAGYSLSKINYKGRDLIFVLMLITMMIPAQAIIIPKFVLFKQMDPDNDTYDTEVVRYVQSLGMTYAEKKRILEKLGFKIDANGKITK